jgi:hypothetical protein
MWSLGRPAGAAGAIPGELVAGLAGKGGERVLGWLGTGLGRSWGRSWPAARRAAAPSGGSRCGLISGEVWAGEKEWSGSVASLGARGGEGPTDSAGAARVRRFAGARPGIDGVPRGTGPPRTGGSRL